MASAAGNAMQTTFYRLTKQGKGIVGCCIENFLTQAHNKSEYTQDPERPDNPATFDVLHKKVGILPSVSHGTFPPLL